MQPPPTPTAGMRLHRRASAAPPGPPSDASRRVGGRSDRRRGLPARQGRQERRFDLLPEVAEVRGVGRDRRRSSRPAPAPLTSVGAAPTAAGATAARQRSARRAGRGPGARRGGPAAQRRSAAHWKRAPRRVRRWEMPTTFRPATVTSPAPSAGEADPVRPGGALERPPVERQAPPGHAERGRARGPRLAHPPGGPSDVVDPQAGRRGARGGRTRPGRRGWSSTAPPPLRRRTTSTPARAAPAGIDVAAGWALPSTSAGRSTRKTQAVRVSGVGQRPAVELGGWPDRSLDRPGGRPAGAAAADGHGRSSTTSDASAATRSARTSTPMPGPSGTIRSPSPSRTTGSVTSSST